jgi:DNA-binding Lrp family transcriptional regulator
MCATVKIDEIDRKILRILMKDARARLKDIAEYCSLSSASVLNRIKRLRNLGVITGATIFPRADLMDLPVIATLGIELNSNDEKIFKLIREHVDLVEPSEAIGKYDLCALVFAGSIAELDKTICSVRKRFSVSKVTVNLWCGEPHMIFENLDLQTKELGKDGQV